MPLERKCDLLGFRLWRPCSDERRVRSIVPLASKPFRNKALADCRNPQYTQVLAANKRLNPPIEPHPQ
jgi:hypothetical protein